MPNYDFNCEKCGYEETELKPISFPKKSKCPKCQNNSLIRLIGNGGGFIFKGDGFYQTDYKKT